MIKKGTRRNDDVLFLVTHVYNCTHLKNKTTHESKYIHTAGDEPKIPTNRRVNIHIIVCLCGKEYGHNGKLLD